MLVTWIRDGIGERRQVVRYGVCPKAGVQVAALAPASGIECRRNGGDKDDSKAGMSDRVRGITIS